MLNHWETKLFERWSSVHALRYFEKYADREIIDDRIFEYLDGAKSVVMVEILKKWSFDELTVQFREALKDFR